MKKLFFFLLIVVLLLSLCACNPAGKAKKTLAYVQRFDVDSYTAHVAEAFAEAAQTLDFTATTVTPADATAASQEMLIKDLIRQGVAGIAISANEVNGLETVIDEAKDAGIPVITVGADTAGSALLVQTYSTEMMGKALMDAMYDITGGEGSFAVISGANSFSGNDPWVSGMELASRDSKYQKLFWVETNYGGNLDGSKEEMKALLTEIINKYPDLEAICCVSGNNLALCSQALEEMDATVHVTGIAQPPQMKDLMGDGRACEGYFMWSPENLGRCAAYALVALLDAPALEEGGTLITQLQEYQLHPSHYAKFHIYAGPPFYFYEQTSDIYTVY